MANEMVATPHRDYPDFPCQMKDADGNTFMCPSGSTYDAWTQAGMVVCKISAADKKKMDAAAAKKQGFLDRQSGKVPDKKATKKKASK